MSDFNAFAPQLPKSSGISAFAPSSQALSLLSSPTGSEYDVISNYILGQRQLEAEQGLANQQMAEKAIAAKMLAEQQAVENKRADAKQAASDALAKAKQDEVAQKNLFVQQQDAKELAAKVEFFRKNPDRAGGLSPEQAALALSPKLASSQGSIAEQVVGVLDKKEADRFLRKELEGSSKQTKANEAILKTIEGIQDRTLDKSGNAKTGMTGGTAGFTQLLEGATSQYKSFRDNVISRGSADSRKGETWTPSKWFTPNLSSLEQLKVQLAYQMAKAADEGGKVSDADFKAQMESLGGGFFSSAGDFQGVLETIASNAQDTINRNRRKRHKTLGLSGEFTDTLRERRFKGVDKTATVKLNNDIKISPTAAKYLQGGL